MMHRKINEIFLKNFKRHKQKRKVQQKFYWTSRMPKQKKKMQAIFKTCENTAAKKFKKIKIKNTHPYIEVVLVSRKTN